MSEEDLAAAGLEWEGSGSGDFGTKDLAAASFIAEDLKAAGFSAMNLASAGFSANCQC